MIPLRAVTLGELLAESVARFPERPALTCRGRVVNYAQMGRQVTALGKGMLAEGMRRGDRVALWAFDSPNAVLCLYAALSVGAIPVLLNTSLGQEEIARLLVQSCSKWLFLGDGYKGASFPAMAAALPSLPNLTTRVYIGEGSEPADMKRLAALIKAGGVLPDADWRQALAAVSPEDSATLLYTSGTSGTPKGVLTSHYARANMALCQAKDLALFSQDRVLDAIPMFHCFSLTVNILGPMTAGACVVLPDDRRTSTLLSAIQREHCTVFCAVPALFHTMAARHDFYEYDLSSLRTGLIGGSPVPPEQMRVYQESFQYDLLPSLGLTECTAGITVASPSDPMEVKLETVGHFMDHIEGCILEPRTRQMLSAGQKGEICVRGYCVMQGYDDMPEETARAVDEEGFLHTGDLGYIDEAGNVHLCGRLKQIIIRAGENIDPCEIEGCLLRDARIADVSVVGVPDRHYGEAICACVIPAPGEALTERQVRDLVGLHLAAYKIPAWVLFWDEIPKTASGKNALALIRARAQAEILRK